MVDKERRARGSKPFEGINDKTKIGIKKWLHKYMKKKGFKHKSSISKHGSKRKSKSERSKGSSSRKEHHRRSKTESKDPSIGEQKRHPHTDQKESKSNTTYQKLMPVESSN